MTLHDALIALGNNPAVVISYFATMPALAILLGRIAPGEGEMSPWKYFYSALIYLTAVPGLFAAFLTVYTVVFEKRSVLQLGLVTQILPVVSMVLTLFTIKRDVELDRIPGFHKLSGLLFVIVALMTAFWILDKTRIVAFTFFPLHYLIALFVGLLVVARFGLKKFGSA